MLAKNIEPESGLKNNSRFLNLGSENLASVQIVRCDMQTSNLIV